MEMGCHRIVSFLPESGIHVGNYYTIGGEPGTSSVQEEFRSQLKYVSIINGTKILGWGYIHLISNRVEPVETGTFLAMLCRHEYIIDPITVVPDFSAHAGRCAAGADPDFCGHDPGPDGKLKSHITDQQLAKGISLIRTFEAGTRTGMVTMHWGMRRIQDLLQETAFQPDVQYIMIVSAGGTILAHSDPPRVGQVLADMPDIIDSEAERGLVHYRYQQEDEEKVFEVYKRFTPMESRFGGHSMRMHGMQRMRGKERPFQGGSGDLGKNKVLEDGALILVGLSMDQMAFAQARLLRHAVGQGVVFFILGCAGVISLMVFQAYRTTKARLVSARALSEKLKKEIETTRHLAAIGKLAGGVAHEIRNPLSSIKGFATYFEKRYADHPDDQETARIMVQEVERINRSVTQLLEFAKPVAVDKKEVEIREMISHSLKLMAHDLEKNLLRFTRIFSRSGQPVTPIRTA